jgi:hypothetical protein
MSKVIKVIRWLKIILFFEHIIHFQFHLVLDFILTSKYNTCWHSHLKVQILTMDENHIQVIRLCDISFCYWTSFSPAWYVMGTASSSQCSCFWKCIQKIKPYPFLTSALNRCEWSASHSSWFISGERECWSHWTWGYCVPKAVWTWWQEETSLWLMAPKLRSSSPRPLTLLCNLNQLIFPL